MKTLFLRVRKAVYTALVLALSSPALADLPTVEGPKSKTDGSFYGKIAGYINDGLVLGGLVVAAVAFIVVAMSCVSTFAEVRDGKATWGKFGAMVAVGVVLIVAVIWLASEASTIVAGYGGTMATIQFMPDRLNAEPVVFRGFTTPELGLTALFSTLAGIVISLPFLFFSWVMIPTIALILPLLVIVFGGKVLARIKRGKPENYLYRRLEAALVQWGLGNPRLILASRRWSLRRSRAVIQREVSL